MFTMKDLIYEGHPNLLKRSKEIKIPASKEDIELGIDLLKFCVISQDAKLNEKTEPVYLTLRENKENTRFQEFTDKTKQITVKIISDYEVRLQLDKARYTLYTSNHLKEVNADTQRILADIALWKNERY